jgi:PPOX class probable F420-dependent enzyme
MSELAPGLRRFLEEQIVGVLATRSSDGAVHQSLVYYALQGDQLLISTLSGRRKALDVEESGWASLCVMGHERPFPALTVSGAAAVRHNEIGLATAAVAQRMLGLDEPPEPQSDDALAEADRVIVTLQIDRVGPTTYVTQD